MDDGKADSGNVTALDGFDVTNKDCVTWIVEFYAPAPYNLSNTNAACRMLFRIGKF